MASITSLMNGSYNTSSIYGNRNVLSGLASGMDTETMIENAVSGIKRKIQSLYQKRTKVEWQQEAYRSIIDKAVNLSNKYTSYSSKTNLLSSSFFNNAVITTAMGTYANKVSATGKTSSDIKINAVKQLATAASYSVSGNAVFGGDASTILGSEGVNLSGNMDVSTVSGSLTLRYGGNNGTSFNLSFDELDVYDNAEELAGAIREKLGEQTWTYTKNGVQETVKGSDVINVQVDANGNIKFSDKTSDGNSVYISSATGNIKSTLGVKTGKDENTLEVGDANLSKSMTTRNYLSDKSLTFSLNGTSKTIKMSDVMKNVDDLELETVPKVGDVKSEAVYDDDGETIKKEAEYYTQEDVDAIEKKNAEAREKYNEQLASAFQTELDKAFGAGKVKASVSGDDSKLSFEAAEKGSTLVMSGTAAKVLGFENGDANYINTSKKLSDLLDKDMLASARLRGTFKNYDGTPTEKTTSSGVKYYVDDAGNRVDKDGYRITDTDEPIYDFEINGAHIQVTGDTTLESLMSSINSNADAGVKVSYSKLTNEFKFTATETGANSKIEFGGLAKKMFGPSASGEDSFADAYGFSVEEGESKWIHFEVDGSKIYSVLIDDNTEGALGSNASIEDIVNDLKQNAKGYTVSYDERSGQIVATDKNGKTTELKIYTSSDMGGKEDVAAVKSKSGASYTDGVDAIMDVEINGVRFENLTRSTNNFDIDGLSITVKDTFSKSDVEDGKDYEPITFETATDTDTIIDAIRNFVNDYNEMVTELKGAYSTQPAYKNGTTRYEPLTAEEEEGYTESQLAAYNEKAKQGILFGDTTLSSMYGKLLNAIAPGGADGQILREIGISTSYENGLTTLSLDEDKLRTTLESDPDKVKNAFTKTIDSGSSSNGLMKTLQNTLDTYVKTTGEPKGVLITRAGSIKAPTSLTNNSLYTQIGNIDKEIDRWQTKMSSQIDRYTKQFSKLEQLVAQMNSQYSALSGLMGGAEGYY